MFDAIVPAGGTIPEEYARKIGTPIRALAPMGLERLPVMQRVVTALRESGCVRRVIGVAPPRVQENVQGVDNWLTSGDSGPGNILAGLSLLDDPDTPACVCTSDLPLLTAGAVQEFLQRADPAADMTLGLVGKRAYEARWPGSPMSVYVRLTDIGPVTMACLFCVRPALITRNAGLLERAFAARKSQWQMASLLGPPLLCRFALRRLTLQSVQTRAENLLRCRANVLLDCPPEVALDMDSVDDYAYADACLHQAAAAAAAA